MGCVASLCHREEIPDVDGRFPVIQICDNDSDSDDELKAKGKSGASRDVTPLLEGPTLLAFNSLNITSSSSDDQEIGQIGQLLKPTEKEPASEEENPVDAGTFKDVNPNIHIKDISSSDDEIE